MPKILTATLMWSFKFVHTTLDENQQGSERQLTRTSDAQFESYVVNGAHRAIGEYGDLHSRWGCHPSLPMAKPRLSGFDNVAKRNAAAVWRKQTDGLFCRCCYENS